MFSGLCSYVCENEGLGKPAFDSPETAAIAMGVRSSGAIPNPTNGHTTIPFHLPTAMHVTVTVYDAAGAQVATLLDKDCVAGDHQTTFIPNNLPNGTYIYKIAGDGSTTIGKIILAR